MNASIRSDNWSQMSEASTSISLPDVSATATAPLLPRHPNRPTDSRAATPFAPPKTIKTGIIPVDVALASKGKRVPKAHVDGGLGGRKKPQCSAEEGPGTAGLGRIVGARVVEGNYMAESVATLAVCTVVGSATVGSLIGVATAALAELGAVALVASLDETGSTLLTGVRIELQLLYG